MNDLTESEQTPFDDGGIPLPDASSQEDGEISENEDELDADFIRNAGAMITIDLDRDPPRTAPNNLTFSLPEARDNLNPAEDPRPRAIRWPLYRYEQFLGTADPPATSDMGNEAGQAAADSLRNSMGLTEEGRISRCMVETKQKKHHS